MQHFRARGLRVIGGGGGGGFGGKREFSSPTPSHHQQQQQPPRPPPTRKFPELLYFPKFFRWLGMKLKLKYMQKAWDPEFSEGAFIYGSTQAICRVTEIIHHDRPHELSGLLTPRAENLLRNDMERKLTPIQRQVVLLQPTDIKLLVPVKVQLVKDDKDQRRCFVLLKSLSMKWYQERQHIKLVLIVIDTEFTREFTSTGGKSEWFISLFNIVQCALIGGNAPPLPPPPPK